MSEQPKRLPLHHKATQVVSEWMGYWSVAIYRCPGKRPVPVGDTELHDLGRRFQAALQDDEQTRADLLAACEALDEWEKNPPADGMTELAVIVLAARTAIAKAKETNDG